ncbi:MAG: hypothetical protein ACR2PR_08775 [Pseudohongiellaceae bacterium]
MIREFFDPVRAIKRLTTPRVGPSPTVASSNEDEAAARDAARERVRIQARRRQGTASTLVAGASARASSAISTSRPTLLSG